MTSTRDLYFQQDEIYYTFHVLNEKNNVDDEFIEDVRTFLLSSFLSTFDTSFQRCQQYSFITISGTNATPR